MAMANANDNRSFSALTFGLCDEVFALASDIVREILTLPLDARQGTRADVERPAAIGPGRVVPRRRPAG